MDLCQIIEMKSPKNKDFHHIKSVRESLMVLWAV